MKHLNLGNDPYRVWCGAEVNAHERTIHASEATCRECVAEYLRVGWKVGAVTTPKCPECGAFTDTAMPARCVGCELLYAMA